MENQILKILKIPVKWLFVLSLPVLLLSASIGWAANSLWLYKHGFYKYDVSQKLADSGLELADSDIDEVYEGLINYFNSGEEYISLTVKKDGKPFELFNQKEIIHLKDVKGLIWLDYFLFLGTLVYALSYAGVCLLWQRRQHWRQLTWSLVGGSSLTLLLMLALGLGIRFGFNQLFTQFHLISFANELWLLDPTKDYLIMLLPLGFFYDATVFIASVTAGLALILGGAGAYLRFVLRRITS